MAWAPAPLTEGSEDADRILNVVATGGTDKVRIGNFIHHVHPLTTTAGDQNMATLIKVLARASSESRLVYRYLLHLITRAHAHEAGFSLLLHNWRLNFFSSKCAFSQKGIVSFIPSTFVPFFLFFFFQLIPINLAVVDPVAHSL